MDSTSVTNVYNIVTLRYVRYVQYSGIVMGGTHGTTLYRDTKFSRYQYRWGHGTLRYYL